MDSLWLEVALDAENQAKVTFTCVRDKQSAEAFAERMCNRRTGPRFFMRSRKDYVTAAEEYAKSLMATSCSAKFYVKNREDFIKMLAKCAEIMEEES